MVAKLRFLAVVGFLIMAPVNYALADGYLLFGAGNSKDDILEESATGIKIGLGSKFQENLAVEVAFVDLGTIDYPFSTEISQYGLAASLLPVYEINEAVAVFARLGLFAWTFEVSSPFGAGEDTGSDLFYGFGFEFKSGDTAAIVAEYEVYEVSGGDVSLLSVGIKFGF